MQLNFGIRVANLSSDLPSSSAFGLLFSDPMATPPDPTSGTESDSSTTTQKSSFLGAGPRVGVEGAVPFGKLSFDYAANAAWLIGNARINSESISSLSITSMPTGSGTNLSFSGVASGSSYSRTISVFNGDFLVGVSYWLTPAMKISVNYRLDAYLNGLRTYDANGSVVSLDRYFQGPELALAAKF